VPSLVFGIDSPHESVGHDRKIIVLSVECRNALLDQFDQYPPESLEVCVALALSTGCRPLTAGKTLAGRDLLRFFVRAEIAR